MLIKSLKKPLSTSCTILHNQWSLTSQVDPRKQVKRRRLLARLKSQQSQEKDYSLRSQRKGTAKLEIGDLVLWQAQNINRKLGKHLSPKFKGPYVVVGLNINSLKELS